MAGVEIQVINENIRRLEVPFMDVFTSVYTVKYDGGYILFDTATYRADVDEYILPMFSELGITRENLKYIFISHNHGDHSGGLARLLEYFPGACVVSRSPRILEKFPYANIISPDDNAELCGVFRLVTVIGHSLDSAALYDTRTKTLITGDGIQLYGLFGSGEWGANIGFPKKHLEELSKLRKMDIESIYAAHDYHPYGYAYIGKEGVAAALDASERPLFEIKKLIEDNPALTDSEIREIYNSSPNHPTVREGVIRAVRAELAEQKTHG